MASTTISMSPNTTKVSPNIQFDASYCKTYPGIMKIAEAVSSLIGFICVQSVPYAAIYSAVGWFSFVSMTAFWVTLILLLFYLFHIIEKLQAVPWLLSEMVFCGTWAVFYFIAAVVAASKGGTDAAFGAAAFFGFVAMLLYGFDGFAKFKGWRHGDVAQGEAAATTSSSGNIPTPPAATPSYPAY